MARPSVPVTMGSPRFRSLDTEAFSITDAWFPPGEVLHAHTHARGIFATMVEGSFDTTIAGPNPRSGQCRFDRHWNISPQ